MNNKISYLVLALLFVSCVSGISYNANGEFSNSNTQQNNSMMINKIQLKTGLNVSNEDFGNLSRGQILRIYLSNGRYANVKIMPSTASAIALNRLNASCEERNCSIELKEVGNGNETKIAYDVQAQKQAKVLGMFKAKMDVSANVDAENGDVISTHRPWWASVSSGVN